MIAHICGFATVQLFLVTTSNNNLWVNLSQNEHELSKSLAHPV
jgi:hypothetical protein